MLERRLQLVVVQESLRQAALRIEVVRLHLERLTVGVDGFLVVLELVVAHTQRIFHLGAAIVFRNGVQHGNGMCHVTGVAVQPGEVEDNIF